MAVGIQSAKTALKELRVDDQTRREIAYGVLKLFVEQQEKKLIDGKTKVKAVSGDDKGAKGEVVEYIFIPYKGISAIVLCDDNNIRDIHIRHLQTI